MSTTTETLLTAEEFRLLPDNGKPRKLVRGRIVEMNVPRPRHGVLCGNICWELSSFIRPRELGRVLTNDSGVVTEHGPDTVRGPDVCYYSYARLPKGPIPEKYLDVVPELVFEVRSPTDRMYRVIDKLMEYMDAGISAGCILDDQTKTLTIYTPDELPHVLTEEEELTLPTIFGEEFRVPVSRFFAE